MSKRFINAPHSLVAPSRYFDAPSDMREAIYLVLESFYLSCQLVFNPEYALEIYYEKIMFHICFSRLPSEHFSVLNVAKATFVGKKFRALQLFYLISSHTKV